MERSRLIFVEGIMGSGKSTTARWLARLLRRTGIPARPVLEARPHPTNVFRSLPHWKQPWLDLTDDELVTRSYVSMCRLCCNLFYKLYDYLVDIR